MTWNRQKPDLLNNGPQSGPRLGGIADRLESLSRTWMRRMCALATAFALCQSGFAWQAPGGAPAPLAIVPAPDRPIRGSSSDPDLINAPLFPTGNWFKRHLNTPSQSFELRAPAKLQDFVAENKLELSLRGYLQLVLANNVDIDIQRMGVEITRNAITRAYAPFDPSLVGSFNSTRSKTPTTSTLEGATTLSQLVQPTILTYNQTMASGLSYNVGFQATKTSTNNTYNFFNPALNGSLVFGANMPLLRNRGAAINRLPITIARSRLRVSQDQFMDTLLTLMSTAENVYWDVVGARETLRVQEKALELTAEALKRSKRELELGAISPLDIYQPEANYAAAEIQVLQARYRLQQSEDALRRQMGADLDSNFRTMPIVLTESVLPPSGDGEVDREQSVSRALRMRPDLKATIEQIGVDELQIRQTVNTMRPDLSLRAGYTSTGRGGNQFVDGNVITGGFGDALGQVFGFGFPVYQFGLNLNLPIRSRSAAANYADAVITRRQDMLRQRSTEQNIRQQVLNAISQVESSKASVKLAAVARDLAQKQLDAEQKKYDLGTTVIFFVLDATTRLVTAEANLVNNTVQYRRNLINLLRQTGELLDDRGIQVDFR